MLSGHIWFKLQKWFASLTARLLIDVLFSAFGRCLSIGPVSCARCSSPLVLREIAVSQRDLCLAPRCGCSTWTFWVQQGCQPAWLHCTNKKRGAPSEKGCLVCLLAGVEDFYRLKLARGVTSSVSLFFLNWVSLHLLNSNFWVALSLVR